MCSIKIGNAQIAYAQNLSFQRNVRHVPVMGVGSYSAHALEPVDYSASGSLTLTRYTSELISNRYGITPPTGVLHGLNPENMDSHNPDSLRNGNSMIDAVSFNPAKLLISYTFDIDVYERGVDDTGTAGGAAVATASGGNLFKHIFKFHDCRLTNYSYDFVPGQLLLENVDFVCRYIQDMQAVSAASVENSNTITLA